MTALKKAPGVLAVEVDYKSGQATIGVDADTPASREDVHAALKSIGYSGTFLEGAARSGSD